ncbi:hypothetical protein FGO68_gene15608 [Halteria grandinella]|uniref:Uncharacterized protein n=1 Tax=Halteria grandinella TaxID=5974 RepID=A0A8J8NL14_HALGN|nr:hypothetical protein FGO68_gene15608 [Halteria grandinella]
MLKWGRQRPRRFVYAVGLYTLGYNLFDLLYPAVAQNLRDSYDLKQRYGEQSWVVVSGATNQLGREFVRHFTAKGLHVVMIDQSEEELQKVKEEAAKGSASPDVKIEGIVFDLKGNNKWQQYEALREQIRKITEEQDISILVNNAEEVDPFGPKIHKAKDEDVLGTLTINTYPMVFITRFLGPDMKSRKTHKSAIINMTSYYSEFHLSSAPVYSSTKAFEDVFSQILGYENQDMDVLTVKNMPYKTQKQPNGVEAGQIVEGVMKDLGRERVSYGHWTHSVGRYWILFRQCQWWFRPAGGMTGPVNGSCGANGCPFSKLKFW